MRLFNKTLGMLGLLLMFSQTLFANNNEFNLNITLSEPLGTPQRDGFLNQVVEGMLKGAGYKPNYEYVFEARGLKNLNEGIDDGNLPRVAGLEKSFPNIRMVPGKVMDFDFQVFAKKSNIKVDGWDSFSDLDVAFVKGWKILEKNVKAKSVTTVPTVQHLFKLLENDRVDAIIYERWQGVGVANALGFNAIKPVEPPLVTKEMFLYVNKKHENIVPVLSKTLEQMKNSGQYEKIEKSTLTNALR